MDIKFDDLFARSVGIGIPEAIWMPGGSLAPKNAGFFSAHGTFLGKALEALLDLSEQREMGDRGLGKILWSLEQFCDLSAGWDGDGSLPATTDAARDAEAFLRKCPGDIPLPHPSVSSDGVIGLFWKTEHGYADASFEGDGSYFYFAVHRPPDGSEEESLKDDCPADSQWAGGLEAILRKILHTATPGGEER